MLDSPKLLLSVIIPVYNYEKFLPDAINSIISQDFNLSDLELIIIDDCSTDSTPKIIEEFAKQYPCIKPIRLPENRGVHYATNCSIDITRGQYLHFMAADDYRYKKFFKKCMELLLANPSIPICSTDPAWADEKTGRYKIRTERLLPEVTQPMIFNSEQVVMLLRNTNFWVPGHTTIFKREVLDKYGSFNPKLGSRCDWYLVHRIALLEGIIYIPEALSVLYTHGESYSANASKKMAALELLNLLDECPRTKDLFVRSNLFAEVYNEYQLS